MKGRMGLFGAIVLVAALVAPVPAQKPGSNTGLWSASATFRSSSSDKVTNDTFDAGHAPIPYVDGQDGVTCVVVPDDPSLQTSGDFSLYFSSKSRRSVFFAAQSKSLDGYQGFASSYSQGSVRVRDVVSVYPGSSDVRTVVLWSYGKLLADGGTEQAPPAGVTVDKALVTRSPDGCTWTITAGTDSNGNTVGFGGHLTRWTGPSTNKYAGVFLMPFEVTVIAGSAPTAYGSCLAQ